MGNAMGAIAGAWIGLVLAIVAWTVHAYAEFGEVTVTTLGALEPCLSGNLVAIFSSGFIHTVLSCMYPDKSGSLGKLNDKLKLKMVADDGKHDMSGLDDEDYSYDELQAAKAWIYRWGCSLTIVLVVIWPLLSLPAGVFTKDYFAFWVFIAVIWGFVAAFVIIFLPIYESSADIGMVLAGVMGYETTSTSNLKSDQKHELHSRVFHLEHAIRQLTGSPVVKPKEPEPEGCMPGDS